MGAHRAPPPRWQVVVLKAVGGIALTLAVVLAAVSVAVVAALILSSRLTRS